jgi:hypothetical protein
MTNVTQKLSLSTNTNYAQLIVERDSRQVSIYIIRLQSGYFSGIDNIRTMNPNKLLAQTKETRNNSSSDFS